MPIKYIPFIPEAVEGQAVLGNFNRILRYKGADELSMTLQRGMPLYEMEKQETVGENTDGSIVIRGECVSACAYLKEQAGGGTVTLLGIRAAESPRRAARNEVQIGNHRFSGSFDQFNRNKERDFACVGGKDKIMLSPIYRWQDSDVWNFIRGNNLPYCRLYDEGYQRIGCIFCPMSSVKNKARDRRRYPGVERAIKRSIQYLIDTNGYMERFHATTDEIFDWWVSNLPADQYFSTLRLQQKIDFDIL